MSIPVLAAPQFDPGARRIALDLPEGLTLTEIVAAAVPGLADHRQLRVALVSAKGASVIDSALWHRVRPRPGVRVVIRVLSGKNDLRAVLSIVVSIAAMTLGGWFAGSVMGLTAGTTAYVATSAGFAAGVSLVGNLLINALIPPVRPASDDRRNRYQISGWSNRLEPGGAVPVVLGQIRHAPPFAVRSWTEIVGDDQFVRAAFLFGEGQVALTDFRLGETSLAEFDDIEIEVREGLIADLPLTICPTQISEEAIGVELTRSLIRDDLGEVTGEPTEDEPVVRTTGADAASASVILAFPGGLVNFDSEGNRGSHSVAIRIEHRLATAEEWAEVAILNITGAKAESFYRQHSWQLPVRGRWQVRLTMLTDETESSSIQQRAAWAALQTIRPEYPLAYPYPLALVGLRIRATHQLNGQLDNFSAVASRICPDWDAPTGTWITRATSNPASLYRWVLQAPCNPKRVTDSGLDLQALADWHVFCASLGLHYNRVLDEAGMTLREALTEIAGAGRAMPRHDGTRWTVVVDRPQELIVDHVGPRNSWDFAISRSYVEQPHAFLVAFADETNDYRPAERMVRRPGYEGPITLTEALALPGLTNPPIVWREALRRFHEATHRPDVLTVTQDGTLLVATRGDEVALSSDVLSRVERTARVRGLAGRLVELDELVEMEAGQDYGLRFRVFADAEDTVGTSVVRPVAAAPGEADLVALTGSGSLPQIGDLVHFGPLAQVSRIVKITGVETTQDQAAILRCVAAAPEIDTLTAAAVIPAWSSRVGEELDPLLLAPPEPRFVSVRSVLNGSAYRIVCLIVPGSGAVQTASYVLEHRAGTAGAWTAISLPVASGGGEITGYARDATMQVRARAVGLTGTAGPDTPAITLVVGAADAAIPAALEADAVTLSALLGGARVEFATGPDVATTQVQVYRSTSATLDRESDAVGSPVPVAAGQTYSVSLGDTTRANLISDPGLASAAAWTLGTGWSVAGGAATHASGSAGAIGQAVSLTSGKWYRFGFTVSGATTGTLRPRLSGGSDRLGEQTSTNDRHFDRIQAVTGNATVEWSASSTFNGSLDDLVVYLETAACLPAGTHHIWLEPQNAAGVPGPALGPITVEIV